MRSIADLFFLFALSSCVARAFIGQDSDDWSVFSLRCLASKTNLTEAFLLMIINGLRKVVPHFGFSKGVQPIRFIVPIFVDHPTKHSIYLDSEKEA